MLIQFTKYLVPHIIALPIIITFAIILFRIKSSEDLKITSFLIVGCAVWVSGYALEIMNVTLTGKIISDSILSFGESIIQSLLFILAAKLAGFTRLLKKDILIILSIKPIAVMILVLTNSFHELVYKNWVVQPNGLLEVASITDYGAAYWAWFSYDCIIGIASTVFLFLILTGRHKFFRRQAAILLFSLIAIWTSEASYIYEFIPASNDYTAIVASFCCVLYWALGYRYLKIGEVVPIKYESIIENINDSVIVLNNKGIVTFLNKPAQNLFLSGPDFMGKHISHFWPDYSLNTTESREDMKIDIAGQTRHFDISQSPIRRARTEVAGKLIILKDITERVKYEEKIKYMSFHDYLTRLYNRAFFDEELVRLDNSRNLPLSIVLGDVNGLKMINDIYGHEKGDELLIKIADILKECFRSSDIISRWGGDEFIVLLPLTEQKIAQEIVTRIENACAKYSTENMIISISLGVSTKVNQDESIEKILKLAEDKMYLQKRGDEKVTHRSVMSSLKRSLYRKDFGTEDHIKRMEILALALGKNLRLAETKLNELVILSALHDIGKISIADSIIQKPGKLSPSEWELVKKHPEVGWHIAKSSMDLAAVADAILAHHENWDGSGYPKGLKGDEIPLLSRIISLVDAYDAMTSERPYREALSREQAILEIRKCSGINYDPGLVEIFMEIVQKF